jgi:hypothetical protein
VAENGTNLSPYLFHGTRDHMMTRTNGISSSTGKSKVFGLWLRPSSSSTGKPGSNRSGQWTRPNRSKDKVNGSKAQYKRFSPNAEERGDSPKLAMRVEVHLDTTKLDSCINYEESNGTVELLHFKLDHKVTTHLIPYSTSCVISYTRCAGSFNIK